MLFSGHIGNRSELRRDLGPCGPGDAALYAAAYAAWGDTADLKVIGQFATIVAAPDAPHLRLSRSPITAPPLSYYNDGCRAIVSNAARVIFATGEVEREIDEDKLDLSLLLNYCDEARGWFVGVRRVPAGHRVVLTPDGTRTERYYDMAALPDVRRASDDAYVEEANALFSEATAAALDGFSRPAISLSGGLDSQAVAAHAIRQRLGQPLYSFTGVPEPGWDGRTAAGTFGDERHHVEALAALYPELHPVFVDAAGLSFDHKQQALFMLGGMPPRNAANFHWIHEVYRLARERGCDVMLGGDYGNASFSFSGDGAMPHWLASGQWPRLWRELGYSRGKRWRMTALMTQAALPLMPRPIRLAVRRLAGRASDRYREWCPLREDYAKASGLEARSLALGFDPDYLSPRSTRQCRTEMFTQGEAEGADVRLSFSELHQMPFRDPTAYRPLVEFCLGIPDDQYLRDGQQRWLARRMLRGMVPDMVVEEKRSGLQAADWHLRLKRERHALIKELDQMSTDPTLAMRIDFAGLRAALIDCPAETPLNSKEAYRLMLAVPRAMTTARFVRYIRGTN